MTDAQIPPDLMEGAPGVFFAGGSAARTFRIYEEIACERRRAYIKHAPHGSVEVKYFQDVSWLPILVEEVGEVAEEINEYSFGATNIETYKQRLKAELIQVAAMATAWAEAIDRA